MAKKTKSKDTPSTRPRRGRYGVDLELLGAKIAARVDLSRKEFCAAQDICLATFSNWEAAGIGPAVTREGGRVTISADARDVWRRRVEASPLPRRGRARKEEAAGQAAG